MTIEPIDKELNRQLLTGENLDMRLFSATDLLQYYEVIDSKGNAPEAIQEDLDQFISANYAKEQLVKGDNLTFLFYKQDPLAHYRDHVYEAARDTETGLIPDHNDGLLARVKFSKIPGKDDKLLRSRIIYDKNEKLLVNKDTIDVKEWEKK